MALACCVVIACGSGSTPASPPVDAEPVARAETRVEAAEPTDDAPQAEAPADPPAEAPGLALDPLPLRATAPPGTTVGPAALEGALLVRGPSLVVALRPAPAGHPATLDDAQAAMRDHAGRRASTETLDDGWLLRFEREDPELGAVLFTQTRRELAGTAYWCESVVPDEATREAATAFCKSLRPAPR